MRILLTGASGFIGQALVGALMDNGHEVHSPGEKQMNLRERWQVDGAVGVIQPEIVIHLAAKTEVAYSFDDYEDFNRVNYLGTVLLAEANARLNPSLKQFIFASTMETYGHHREQRPFTENTEQNPMAPYAVAKVACEKYLYYLRNTAQFPCTILRQTNTYGRTKNDFFVMERILTQMMSGSVVNLGEASPVRNFLFVDDLVALYLKTINNPKAIGQTFVTGPANGIAISQLVAMCSLALHWDGDVNWHTIPRRPGEIYYLNSDPAKAKELLDWEPSVDLHAGIRMTIERIREAKRLKQAA